MKKVAIIMGSDSDLPIVTPAIKQLKELGIDTEVRVMSAHRTPEQAHEFSKNAMGNGFGVIIAAAGMAAHLGGVLAAGTTIPVIGIPCSAKVLDGMDAMLATVMMPPGIPVATVGVNAAKNAAILAGGTIGTHLQMGIGDGLIPGNLNLNIYSSVYIVTDEEAIETAKDLARLEGIMCGISSGTNVAAAKKLAKKLGKGKTVVTILPDTAERYFSTPLFENE